MSYILAGRQNTKGKWIELYIFLEGARLPKQWKVASTHKTYEAANRRREELKR